MKWNSQNIQNLKDLLDRGLSYKEISGILGTYSEKAIKNKCYKLGLIYKYTISYYTKYECEICKKYFSDLISNKRKFCSSSCSAKLSNGKRKYTVEQKERFKEILSKYRLPRKHYVCNNRNFRVCNKCNIDFYSKKYKQFCERCIYDYYNIYRPKCEFDFDIHSLCYKFDNYDLVEKFGIYSPSNKGNNLSGGSRDHMVSVKWGFENKIDPNIIKHPANCNLMLHTETNIKKTCNSISYNELLIRISNWDKIIEEE